MGEEFDYLFHIYKCENIKQIRKYLINIKNNFGKLKKKEKKKYIELILRIVWAMNFDEILETKKEYYIYYNKQSLQRMVLKDLIYINIDNFDLVIDSILELLSEFNDKNETSKITKKDINTVFKILNDKIDMSKILNNIRLEIYILNYSHKKNNSFSIPSNDFKNFIIVCFYLKNDEEYQKGMNNPIYVFLHELGHIICWIVTQKIMEVPDLFFKSLNKFFPTLDKDNPDALEVFADCFAMYAMHNTSLDIYNPFTSFSEEFYICLEKLFKELLKNIKE